MTRGAVAVVPGEGVADLAGAAVWGLVRSAQSENPGRLVLADLPMSVPEAGIGVLAAALDGGEPEVAVRDGVAYGRRLARPSGGLVPPDGGVPWRLAAAEEGTLDGLRLAPFPQAARCWGLGRCGWRSGRPLNFRDVLIGLGMYPGAAVMGAEIAGVVAETGPG